MPPWRSCSRCATALLRRPALATGARAVRRELGPAGRVSRRRGDARGLDPPSSRCEGGRARALASRAARRRAARPTASRTSGSSPPSYLGLVPADADPGLPDDTAWHPVDRLPPTAFDHGAIVLAGRERLRAKLSYTNAGFALAPETFTISQLRDLYAAALGHDVSATNLQRVLLRRNVLEPTGERREPGPRRRTSGLASSASVAASSRSPTSSPSSGRRGDAPARPAPRSAADRALGRRSHDRARRARDAGRGAPGARRRLHPRERDAPGSRSSPADRGRRARRGGDRGRAEPQPRRLRAGTRQNAHGVDLNRNFPSNWARIGTRGVVPVVGPAAAVGARVALRGEARSGSSGRRSRSGSTSTRIRPRLGQSIPTARRFARLADYAVPSIEWPFGTASNWQNHRFPGRRRSSSSCLPAPSRLALGAWVRAIRELARDGRRLTRASSA